MAYLLNTISGNSLKENLLPLKMLLIMVLLMLSSCSNVPPAQQIKVAQENIDKPKSCYAIPKPTPIKTKEVTWVVVTPKTYKNQVLFALSPKDYEELAANQAEIIRWVTEAMWRLTQYENQANGDDK